MKDILDPDRVADADHFLDRTADRKRLAGHVRDGRNLLVYGDRRLGKTSLLHRVGADLADSHVFLHVDVLFVTDETELAREILDTLRTTSLARRKRFAAWVQEAVQGRDITVSLGGRHGVSFTLHGKDPGHGLRDTLQFLEAVAEASQARIVLVLDEFHTVMGWDTDTVARLRSCAQTQRRVQYVLSGSRPTALLRLTEKQSPFWRQLTEFEVEGVDLDEFADALEARSGLQVDAGARQAIRAACRSNTQRIVQVLRIGLGHHPVLDASTATHAIGRALEDNRTEYERILEQVPTAYQRKVLLALAEAPPRHPTGTAFIKQHDLRGPGHVRKALLRLQALEILDPKNHFVDPLFEHFLRRGRRADIP